MTARILDGAETARLMKEELAGWVGALRERDVIPCFGSILVGEDDEDRGTVNTRHKDCAAVGIPTLRRELPADASQADVEAVIQELNQDPACTAFGVQQSAGLDKFRLLAAIDPAKDVEGLHPYNLGKLVLGEPGPLPCAAIGILELLRHHDVPIDGADVCVIGRGESVGRPLGLLLSRRSENATVTTCHTGTRDLSTKVRRADIVVAAAGVPGLVTADMVKPGATVVDVGLSQVKGKVTGDVSADVFEVAGWISRNPGGVGPMTRAMLLYNIVSIAERSLELAHA